MEDSGNRGSLIGLHERNLRYLAREASANMFIGPEPVLDIFFCHVSLRGLCPYFWPKHSKGYLTLGSGGLNPEGIRKTYPRSYQPFIKDAGRKVKELGGTMGLLAKGLHTLRPWGLKHIVYCTLFYYEVVCFDVFLITLRMHSWQAWMLAMTTAPSKLMLYCVSTKHLAGNGHWLLGLMSQTQRTRSQEMFCTDSSLFGSLDKSSHSLCLRFSTVNATTATFIYVPYNRRQ